MAGDECDFADADGGGGGGGSGANALFAGSTV